MAKDRVYEFSAPGRVEISGNHTDHQHGRVLAAAIDLTTNASVCKNDDEVIRVFSQGYDPVEVYIHYLELHEAEKNTTVALVRGVSAAFVQRGCPIGGFDARISSTVLPGSGLSSSASYAAIPEELHRVCGVFGKEYLRDVDEAEFYRRLPEVRIDGFIGILENDLHAFTHGSHLRLGILEDILSLEQHFAFGAVDKPEYYPAEGRFATAGLSHNTQRLPLLDIKRQIIHGMQQAMGGIKILF